MQLDADMFRYRRKIIQDFCLKTRSAKPMAITVPTLCWSAYVTRTYWYTRTVMRVSSGYRDSCKFERFVNRFSRFLPTQYCFPSLVATWRTAMPDFYFAPKNILPKFYETKKKKKKGKKEEKMCVSWSNIKKEGEIVMLWSKRETVCIYEILGQTLSTLGKSTLCVVWIFLNKYLFEIIIPALFRLTCVMYV